MFYGLSWSRLQCLFWAAGGCLPGRMPWRRGWKATPTGLF
jgi:hypothetical protein